MSKKYWPRFRVRNSTYFAFKIFIFFLLKCTYSVSVKCLIFTLIIEFYLFFDQNTDGKEITIDKDNISKVRFFQILLIR
jgi:hypothetical protein